MAKKAFVPPRIAPLQRVIAVPITDPAEQAALDKVRKREKRRHGRRKGKTNRDGARAASNFVAGKRK